MESPRKSCMTMVNSLHPKSLNAFLSITTLKISRFRISIPTPRKVEAYNKIVKNEFISVEDISSKDEGKLRYDMFVKAYNDKREYVDINGLTPSEMFLQTFNRSHNRNNNK